MKAREFLQEKNSKVAPLVTHKAATPGYSTSRGQDRYYNLYRASMMMAKYPDNIDDIPPESDIGNSMYVGQYTPVEREMYKAACKALGMPYHEVDKGPSKELDDTNKQSPVIGFKGFNK